VISVALAYDCDIDQVLSRKGTSKVSRWSRAGHRRHILVRLDSAGTSHQVLGWLQARNAPQRRVEYSIGSRIDEDDRTAITTLPDSAWTPALDADGHVRAGAFVAELTGLLTLTGWPDGMRVIVRRNAHTPAPWTLFETRGGPKCVCHGGRVGRTTRGVGLSGTSSGLHSWTQFPSPHNQPMIAPMMAPMIIPIWPPSAPPTTMPQNMPSNTSGPFPHLV
jgi:Transposase DDE domain group 1